MTNPRTLAAFLHDLVAAGLAWMLAFWLRFNFDLPPEFAASATRSLVWIVPLFGILFFTFGLYRGLWRFASLSDLQHLIYAVVSGAVLTLVAVVFLRLEGIPRSVLVMHPMLLALMMGGSRFAYRSWKEHRLYGPTKMRGQPVLVLGAGEAADSLLRELHRSGLWYAVAVVSKDPANKGRRLRGLPVFGPLQIIPDLAQKYSVQHVIMAMPASTTLERRQAAEIASAAGLTVMTMPSYDDLLAGRVSVSSIRRVELEDLLGRDAVALDQDGLHELLTDRVVLVSGAGGSIGAELCRQIARFSPTRLVLLETSEFALYQIDEDLAHTFPGIVRSCWAGDVRDNERVAELLAAERPDVIFHAAAYKHVPLMEYANAWQAVRTNAFGTLTLARAAQKAGVDKFVLISTDKAVNPTNVMGASKRLAERLCRSIQNEGKTRFVTVRFGNVLGSNGSVIPKFREQIARGGPVTVTHPDIVRFFMTIPEAAQLVLQAGWMGQGGEIFVLDMGEPVKIVDLARDMIRLSGFSEEEIRLEFPGLRPGEKLFEELLADGETALATPHPKLRIAKQTDKMSDAEFAELQAWLLPKVKDFSEVRVGLKRFVPEYVNP
ncbi:nucleoside-diphosphate sugar epimerase/dehydratase [Azonexus sp.]|uniref:nucleoside-diphosphate sugar epimerase/dehydratase n=1 Tax=Azonexus sp. TaxID=1872668 RepID=UPI0027BA24EB|nr:nucleoside-diphosphate sugar epimerase/dehydratase [Azonexus sp.]